MKLKAIRQHIYSAPLKRPTTDTCPVTGCNQDCVSVLAYEATSKQAVYVAPTTPLILHDSPSRVTTSNNKPTCQANTFGKARSKSCLTASQHQTSPHCHVMLTSHSQFPPAAATPHRSSVKSKLLLPHPSQPSPTSTDFYCGRIHVNVTPL